MAAEDTETDIVPELDFREIIGINVRFLQWLGIIKPDVRPTLLILWYFLHAGAVLALTSLLTSELMNMILVLGDLEQMIEASFLTLTHLIYGYKIYIVYKCENRVNSLISSLNDRVFQPKSMKQYRILKSHIQDSKIISTLFLCACAGVAGFWVINSFIEEDNVLPVAGWFPFDTTYSPAFEIAYVYQTAAVNMTGLTDVSVDTFMSGLIMVVCAQLKILNDSLKNIREYAEMEIDDNVARVGRGISPELQRKMDENLVQCVVHHRRILEFAKEVKSLFTYGILGQFIVSVVIICLTLFQIVQLPWTSVQFFSLVLYQYCMLWEIFLPCYYGNEVILESTELTKSAHCSNWIDCSAKYRRNLLFFMTRSQRELVLYAGGFFALSLETFVKIVKSSWSCFAFLNTMNVEED